MFINRPTIEPWYILEVVCSLFLKMANLQVVPYSKRKTEDQPSLQESKVQRTDTVNEVHTSTAWTKPVLQRQNAMVESVQEAPAKEPHETPVKEQGRTFMIMLHIGG